MLETAEPASADFGPIDFVRAEFAPDVAARAGACVHCGRPFVDAYYTFGPNVHCAGCHSALRATISRGPGAAGLVRALGFGVAAAAIGALLWAFVTAATGYSIGLIAVAVGWGVGNAIRRGSGGFGGLPFQAMAVVLTYLAIVSSYVPEILDVMQARQVEVAASTEQWDESGNAAAPSSADSSSADVSIEMWLSAFALAITLPFLMGLDNAIGLLIIGIALFEAWRINRGALPDTLGPFRISASRRIRESDIA